MAVTAAASADISRAGHTAAAVEALAEAALTEPDFTGWLVSVLATVAAAQGSADALTGRSPATWQGDLLQLMLKGTVGWEDEHLARWLPNAAP